MLTREYRDKKAKRTILQFHLKIEQDQSKGTLWIQDEQYGQDLAANWIAILSSNARRYQMVHCMKVGRRRSQRGASTVPSLSYEDRYIHNRTRARSHKEPKPTTSSLTQLMVYLRL